MLTHPSCRKALLPRYESEHPEGEPAGQMMPNANGKTCCAVLRILIDLHAVAAFKFLLQAFASTPPSLVQVVEQTDEFVEES